MPAGVAVGLFGLVPGLVVEPDEFGDEPGLVTVGSGPLVPGAVPDGVLPPVVPLVVPPVMPPVVPVLPVGVPDESGVVDDAPEVDVPLPIELDDDGDEADVDEPDASPPLDGVVEDGDDDGALVVDVLPVADVVDGFDIELSVFGGSVLLQAPKAATVAAMATHLIERSMFGS